MRELLQHVPTLVKTYGKWPSFAVLLLATVQGTATLAILVALHYLLR